MDEIEEIKRLKDSNEMMTEQAIKFRDMAQEYSFLIAQLSDALEEANKSARNLKWQEWAKLVHKSREAITGKHRESPLL